MDSVESGCGFWLNFPTMGRQWLHAKRLVAGLKKGRTTGKLVREISVAAKMGGADPAMNARLFTAVEKAKKESVTKDAIQRAINKGAGLGGEKLIMEHVVYEGRAPHNVPVIVEVYTDNVNRTAPEIRVLFKKGASPPRTAPRNSPHARCSDTASCRFAAWPAWHPRNTRSHLPYPDAASCNSHRSEEHTSELQSLRHLVC